LAELDAGAKSLGAAVEDMRRRLDEIAAAAQSARDTAARSAGSSTAAAANVTNDVEALARRVQALESATSVANDIESLRQRVQAAEAAAQSLQTAVASANAPDHDREARFASAALALRIAVERSEPFTAELAAIKPLVRDPARLQALDAVAPEGVPSANALARELSNQLVSIRRATESPADTTGVFDRLQQGASRLIRVRPADEATRTDSGDALAGIEAKAARSDVAGALAEANKLPEAQRAPIEPWIKKAQARAAALEAAHALFREGLAAMGATAEPARR
jgi:hypothetical protein